MSLTKDFIFSLSLNIVQQLELRPEGSNWKLSLLERGERQSGQGTLYIRRETLSQIFNRDETNARV